MKEKNVSEMIKLLDNYDDILLFCDLREVLKIGKNKAYELLNSNVIPSFRIGRDFRIPKIGVINYIYNFLK